MGTTQENNSIPKRLEHKPRGEVRTSRATRWRILSLVLVHVVALAHVAHWWITGNTLSPVEPSEAFETIAYGTVNAGFILLVLLILSTLIFGRFFCGWACHLVAYQDFCAGLLGRFGLRPKPVRSRLLAWVPVFAAVDIFILPAVQHWLGDSGAVWSVTWATTTDSLWRTFPGLGMAIATLAVCGFLVVWFFGSKGFCSYGCPYGALFGLADKASKGRIRVTDACEGCGHCTAVCTSNVEVHREVRSFGMVVDSGCMKCMDCVSVCPKDALFFGFSKSPGTEHAAPKKVSRAYDFTWPEELFMAALFAFGVYAFRNLYGAIPFLLAVGMATIVALVGVLFLRLLSTRSLSFQHLVLRTSPGANGHGKRTTAGAFASLGGVVLLAFTTHSALIQHYQRKGVQANSRAALAAPGSTESIAAIQLATTCLKIVADWSLVDTAEVHNRLGQLYAHLDKLNLSKSHLARAIELDPDNVSAHVALGEAHLADGEDNKAATALLAALTLRPGESRAANAMVALMMRNAAIRPTVIPKLQEIAAAFPDQPELQLEAELRLAEAHVANQDWDQAVALLDKILAQNDAHQLALRTLAVVLRFAPDHAGANALGARIQSLQAE